jgi:excinuclease UvrABC nuclease subunit
MYKQRKAYPYKLINGVKHTTFNIRGVAGVYLIYDVYDKDLILYVGYSGNNLYRTMYHHFNNWNSKQYRAVYSDKHQVRVVYCKTAAQAHNLETALIIKYNPIGNKNFYKDMETEPKEDIALMEYLDEETQPIAEYKGDIEF